jgi:hypothetical protein
MTTGGNSTFTAKRAIISTVVSIKPFWHKKLFDKDKHSSLFQPAIIDKE